MESCLDHWTRNTWKVRKTDAFGTLVYILCFSVTVICRLLIYCVFFSAEHYVHEVLIKETTTTTGSQRPTASSATKELDDLMASLSDFKVSLIFVVCVGFLNVFWDKSANSFLLWLNEYLKWNYTCKAKCIPVIFN